MKVIKKGRLIIVLLTVAAALLLTVYLVGRENTGLETFRSGEGWGYTVTIRGKMVIKQPFIPAIEGTKSFETKRDALRIGRIVKKKIEKGIDPSVTIEELHKAGIST